MFTNSHRTDSAAQNDILQSRRSGLISWERTRLKKKKLQLFTPRTSENSRIHSQGGRHIFTPENESVEQWLETYTANEKSRWGVPLVKILIPSDLRASILVSLNKMNINYLSLFPDVEGAAKHCNMAHIENTWSGIREY